VLRHREHVHRASCFDRRARLISGDGRRSSVMKIRNAILFMRELVKSWEGEIYGDAEATGYNVYQTL